MPQSHPVFHATTILGVIKGGRVALGGDGQVTFGNTVIKHQGNKVRKLYRDQVLAGFAGAAADAFTLFERFEEKLEQYNGNLTKAAVELAKDWRTDRYLRRLEAMLIVADRDNLLLLSGSGEVIEPDDDCLAVGSGGNFALASARTLLRHTKMDAKQIVKEGLKVAAELCVYTNDSISVETLGK